MNLRTSSSNPMAVRHTADQEDRLRMWKHATPCRASPRPFSSVHICAEFRRTDYLRITGDVFE
jgi:hypothetical protein